jgi:hypothetical protein
MRQKEDAGSWQMRPWLMQEGKRPEEERQALGRTAPDFEFPDAAVSTSFYA